MRRVGTMNAPEVCSHLREFAIHITAKGNRLAFSTAYDSCFQNHSGEV
jgi:hypothetical protein